MQYRKMDGSESVTDRPAAAKADVTESKELGSSDEIKPVKSKQPIKLTYKALVEKLQKLQNTRKDKLNRARNLRKVAQELMQSRNALEVKGVLEKIVNLCDEAKNVHESVVSLMDTEGKEKQNTWFAAKMLVEKGFISHVKQWLIDTGDNVDNVDDDDVVNPDEHIKCCY